MKFPKPQNQAEREALNSVFERISAEWGFAPGFGPSDLFQHWRKFVQEVEDGYQLSVCDFTFDLSMRDLLEEIKEAVPLRFRQEVDVALRPWDERFWLATQPSIKPIEAGVEENVKEWWFRIPKRSGPELESYLLREGLLGHR